jgi:glycosyltransferase involved in cell wall biosynthesis
MGGIASYLKEISVAMVKRGHQVTVIAASDDTRIETDEMVDGVRVIRLGGGDFIVPEKENTFFGLRKLRMFYRFYSYRKRIYNALSHLQSVEVVEVPDYGAEGYYLRNLNIPVTMRLHTATLLDRERGGIKQWHLTYTHEYWVGKKELALMSVFTNVTSCCQSLLDWSSKFVSNFTKQGITIYNPIDLSSWCFEEKNEYSENTVAYVGTVAETKGVGDLIRAVAILRESGMPVHLKIAGKLGSYGVQLRRECEANGYSWVEFLGHISRDRLKILYRSSKVACFPSWWEALCMVCLEAMAIGNVVIGSRNGGMSEIITDGVDGFLISPQNPQQLAQTIAHALNISDKEVSDIRHNAYHRIHNAFSTDVISAQLENYYKSLKR